MKLDHLDLPIKVDLNEVSPSAKTGAVDQQVQGHTGSDTFLHFLQTGGFGEIGSQGLGSDAIPPA
jgi:hypothetical protein